EGKAAALVERGAVDVFERDVRDVQMLADLVDGGDVRMAEARGDLRLVDEARGHLDVVLAQQLEGDEPLELLLVGKMDHAGPALAELADEDVFAELVGGVELRLRDLGGRSDATSRLRP